VAEAGTNLRMSSGLRIYLQDHLAGSTFGLELVERCRRNNEGTQFGEPLAELASEIAEDRRTLLAVMREVGAQPSRVKVGAGWALEKARRLKPNGRLFGYTPLDRVLELESLAIGIAGKRAMWRVLDDLGARGELALSDDFSALAERADSQIERVEVLRLEAGRVAFGSTAQATV
jgi:hypothetical protein